MRRIEDLEAFARAVEAKKAGLAIGDAAIEQARNSGRRRSAHKRAVLEEIRLRAEANGLRLLPANY